MDLIHALLNPRTLLGLRETDILAFRGQVSGEEAGGQGVQGDGGEISRKVRERECQCQVMTSPFLLTSAFEPRRPGLTPSPLRVDPSSNMPAASSSSLSSNAFLPYAYLPPSFATCTATTFARSPSSCGRETCDHALPPLVIAPAEHDMNSSFKCAPPPRRFHNNYGKPFTLRRCAAVYEARVIRH